MRDFYIDNDAPVSKAEVSTPVFVRVSDGKQFVAVPSGSVNVAISATDKPINASGNPAGVGVSSIDYSSSNAAGPFATIVGDSVVIPVTGSGEHSIYFKSKDKLGNIEELKSFRINLDLSAPVTNILPRAPYFRPSESIVYIGRPASGMAGVFLEANDGNGVGVGSDGISYSIDNEALHGYQTGILIPFESEGEHSLGYQSIDRLGFIEPEKNSIIRIDKNSPSVSFTPDTGGHFVQRNGKWFVGAASLFRTTVVDPEILPGIPGSGAGFVTVKMGNGIGNTSSPPEGAQVASYSSVTACPVTEGLYTVIVTGKDRLLNTSSISVDVVVDTGPPMVSLVPGAHFIDNGVGKYVDQNTELTVTASDPNVSGIAGSGVESVSYSIDGGQILVTAGNMVNIQPQSVGKHTITYFARDYSWNESVHKSFEYEVLSGTLPSVVMEIFGPRKDSAGKVFLQGAGVSSASHVLLKTTVGGPQKIGYRWGSGISQVASGPSLDLGILPQGLYTLVFYGVDDSSGQPVYEAETGVSIVADSGAPGISMTQPAGSITNDMDTPNDISDDVLCVLPDMVLNAAATEPMVDGAAGAGLDIFQYRFDGAVMSAVTGPINVLGEGLHILNLEASDRVANNSISSYRIGVDGSAPVTSVVASGFLTMIDGINWAPAGTNFILTSADRPSSGGSGVDAIYYSVDGSNPNSVYALNSKIGFTNNQINLKFKAVDRLGNTEGVSTFQAKMDDLPPSGVSLVVSGPSYVSASGQKYGTQATTYGITAVDSGSGIGRIEIRKDTALFEPYAMPVKYTGEGSHHLAAKVIDRVGNYSPVAEYPLFTDASAPITVASITSGPRHIEAGVTRISSKSKIALVSSDPNLADGVPGSGLKDIKYRFGAGTDKIYSIPFSVAGSDGLVNIYLYGRDNLLNTEISSVPFSVRLDNTPPGSPVASVDTASGNVVLTWTENTESDFAGYKLFRVVDGIRTQLGGPELLVAQTYTDLNATSLTFTTLEYEVVPVDAVENEGNAGKVGVPQSALASKVTLSINGNDLIDGAFINSPTVTLSVRIINSTSSSTVVKRGDGTEAGSSSNSSFDLDLIGEGYYEVQVTTNKGGIVSVLKKTLNVDRTYPSISATANGLALADGAAIAPPVLLEFLGSDTNLDVVAATLNGSPIVSGLTVNLAGDYLLEVSAKDKAGNETVLRRSFRVVAGPPSVVNAVIVAGDGLVKMSWNVMPGSNPTQSIRIYRKEGSNSEALVSTLGAAARSWMDIGVENRVAYSYRIVPVDSTGSVGADSGVIAATPLTKDWPMCLRDSLHEGSDPALSLSPPLAERWQINLTKEASGRGFTGYQSPIAVSGTLFAVSSGGEVRAVKSETGELLWQKTGYTGAVGALAYHNGLIYVSYGGGLAVLDEVTGQVVWSLPSNVYGIGQESSPIVYKGVVYAGTLLNGALNLVAVDIATHSVKWTAGGMADFLKAAPAAALGKVYMIDGGGNVRAYNSDTGTQLWTRSLGAYGSTTEAVSLSAYPPVVLVTHENGYLYAISSETGVVNWSQYVGGRYSSPVVSGNTVVAAADALNSLYARDLTTGAIKWVASTFPAGSGNFNGGPIILGGRVHVFSTNGEVYAFDLANGAKLDTVQLSGIMMMRGHVTSAAGTNMFIAGFYGELVALTPVTVAPLNLAANNNGNNVILTWTAPAANIYGIKGYRIYRSGTGGVLGTAIADTSGAATVTYADGQMPLGAQYFYTIKALDDRGVEGKPSNQASVATYLDVIMTGVKAEAGDGKIRVTWDAPAPADGVAYVDIYRTENGGAQVYLGRVAASARVYLDIKVENRIGYGYSLRPVNGLNQLGRPSVEVAATPLTRDWPMYLRDSLHEGTDAGISLSPPLAERWRISLTAEASGRGFTGYQTPIAVCGTLFAVSSGGEVRAVKSETGQLLWQKTGYTGAVGALAYHNGLVYVSYGGGLAVLDEVTGQVAWSLPSNVFGVGQESAPIIYRGVLYAGTLLNGSLRLVAVDISTHAVKWTASGMSTFLKAAPAAALGKVYLIDGGGNVRAFNADTGSQLWTRSLGSYGSTTEAVSLSAYPPIVLVTHENGYLYAINSDLGYIEWGRYVGGRYTSPVVSGNTVVAASDATNDLYALDLLTGNDKWPVAHTFPSGGGFFNGGPIILGGRVHIFSTNGEVYAFDLATGAKQDTAQISGVTLTRGHMSAAGTNMFIAGFYGQLVAMTSVTSAPTNPQAVPGVESVALNWTAAVPNAYPVDKYLVESSGSAGGPFTVAAETGSGTTAATIVVPGGVTRYYRVTAVDSRGLKGYPSAVIPATAFFQPNVVAAISSPVEGGLTCLGNQFAVVGTVMSGNTPHFVLEVDEGSGFRKINEADGPIQNAQLGVVTVSGAGNPRLRLTVTDASGAFLVREVSLYAPAKNLTALVSWPSNTQNFIADCGAGNPFSVPIKGSIYGDNFAGYEIRVLKGAVVESSRLFTQPVTAANGDLGVAELLTCGDYTISVIARDTCGREAQTDIFITAQNGQMLVANIVIFSTRGRGAEQHRRPMDVAVDREGYVWVVDTQNNRVQKYTAAGQYLFESGEQRTGQSDGLTFREPVAAAVLPDNSVLILDRSNGEISRLDPNGRMQGYFGGHGSEYGAFNHPYGLTADAWGRVFVADTLNNRVQILDQEGNAGIIFGGAGTDAGLFGHPMGINLDSVTGNIIVTDTGNNRVQLFTYSYQPFARFGAEGIASTLFSQPFETVITGDRNLFTSDTGNNRVIWRTLFGPEERVITAIPPQGYPDGIFKQPHGLALNNDDSMLFVADTGNNRIVGIRLKQPAADAIAPNALIITPSEGATIYGVVSVTGIAADAHFQNYKLEAAAGVNPAVFSAIVSSSEPVWNGELGIWDVNKLASGYWTLRLTVTDRTGNTTTTERVVIVGGAPSLIASASAQPSTFMPDRVGTSVGYWLNQDASVEAAILASGSNEPVWISNPAVSGRIGGIAGPNNITWDGRNRTGNTVPPGEYLFILTARNGAGVSRKTISLTALASPEFLARRPGGGAYTEAVSSVDSVTSVEAAAAAMSQPGQSENMGVPGQAGGAGSGGIIPGGNGASGGSSTNSGTHDNGMGNGANPKGVDRGSNPGKHKGNK